MLTETRKINKRINFKRKGDFQYISKSYQNPFFNNKKRNKKKLTKINIKLKIVLLFLMLIIIALVWFLFYSNFFLIKNFDIEGKGMINSEKIHDYALEQTKKNFWIFISQKNLFFFNKKTLRKKLEEKYSFEYLYIKKIIPNTIKISYAGKKYKIIWEKDGKYYYGDEEGTIINQVNVLDAKLKDYPIIKDCQNKNGLQEKIKYILQLFEELKKYKDFAPEKFAIKETDTIEVKLINGPKILFNFKKEMDFQIKKLLTIKEKIKDEFKNKKYIDLRFGDGVYISNTH